MLSWDGDGRLVVRGTTFQLLTTLSAIPRGIEGGERPGMDDDEFFIFKTRELVERHAALIAEIQPLQIFELGIFSGGSTLFLAELARPRKLVAIDGRPLSEVRRLLEQHAARRDLADVVRTYGEVDQGDRHRLAEIVEREFRGEPLDLVVDDCSHLYEQTRASFNELFPRLRPGGAYVIEDWRWAHTPVGEEPLDGMFPDRVPLTRLLFEIVLSIPGCPGLVRDISVEHQIAVVTRGGAPIDPAGFDIAACSNPRGQRMLTGSAG